MTLPHDDPLDPATPRPADPRTTDAGADRTAEGERLDRTADYDPADRTDGDSLDRRADGDALDGGARSDALDRTADGGRPEYSVDQVGDDQAPVIPSGERSDEPWTGADETPTTPNTATGTPAGTGALAGTPPDAGTPAATPAGTPAATEATTSEPLVAPAEAVDFKARWDVIQQGFVDDPRSAVTDADKLVSDVLERLSATFDEQHRTLEGQWSDGEPDTEALRSALQRYRAFFQRLLTI
ncbi:hypothetical protein [Kribbella sp. NPDC023855]|uniref:hypothetical protein n=1 Tax=Kribbella sp. NPDC023855 TaxID=3154698 RepID=UPI0033E83F7B